MANGGRAEAEGSPARVKKATWGACSLRERPDAFRDRASMICKHALVYESEICMGMDVEQLSHWSQRGQAEDTLVMSSGYKKSVFSVPKNTSVNQSAIKLNSPENGLKIMHKTCARSS